MDLDGIGAMLTRLNLLDIVLELSVKLNTSIPYLAKLSV